MVELQEIQKEALVKTLAEMKTNGYDYLKKITAVDYVDHLEVVYFMYNTKENKDETVIVKLQPTNPEIESVIKIHKSADWYERELSEMFGIKILGRKAKRLLLEKWNGSRPAFKEEFCMGQS